MSARDKFEGIKADYWDCREAEQLSLEDPISALEEWIDCHLSPGCNAEREIRELGDISVDAYVRNAIDESDIRRATEDALQAACNHFNENYGDPDGDDHSVGLDTTKHFPAFQAAVKALYADATVWRCEIGTSVVLTPDEVLELMRVERPDWFETSTPAE